MAYKSIHEEFWTNPKNNNKSIDLKYLMIYLITNPYTHFSGIYYLPKSIIADQTGISDRSIDRGIETLSNDDFLTYNTEYKMVFVHKMLQYQSKIDSLNTNQIKGIINHFKTLHNCPLILEFIARYPELDLLDYTPMDTPIHRGVDTPMPISNSNSNSNSNTSKGGMNYSFDEFWNRYNKKVGNKQKLEKKWIALSDDERKKAIEYIPMYIKSQPDKKYRKNPETFLNNKSWDDEIIDRRNINHQNDDRYTNQPPLARKGTPSWEDG